MDNVKRIQGKGGEVYQQILSDRDIETSRNNFCLHPSSNYSLIMSDCEVVGINGDCGLDCPVFMRGDCKEEKEVILHNEKQASEGGK